MPFFDLGPVARDFSISSSEGAGDRDDRDDSSEESSAAAMMNGFWEMRFVVAGSAQARSRYSVDVAGWIR
jgi:hypothetical protein